MSVDVNAAFAAERATQLARAEQTRADIDARVAAGTLRPLGDGRYMVTDPESWDNGEVLRLGNGMLMPEHGLDLKADGKAALYTAAPTWHREGTVIPGGTSDIDTVLRLAGIDWEVEKRQVHYGFTADGDALPTMRAMPDRYVTVRTDTGAALGVVSDRYQIFQQRDMFAFAQELVDRYDVIWESAGSLYGGRRVFLSLRLPDTVTVDAEGISDEIVPFLVLSNSHDGRTNGESTVTPWRPVCRNTERFSLRDAYTRWSLRHSKGALQRLAEARHTLGLTVRYYREFAAEETRLAQTDITIDEFNQMITDLWPVAPDAPKRAITNADTRRDQLNEVFATEIGRVGRTAYAAERAFTGWVDHLAPRRPGKTMTQEAARSAAALLGTDDDLKTRAHTRLMTLIRR